MGARQRSGRGGQRHRDLAVHRARTFSEAAERRAQRAVAVSSWLLAPYIAAQSAWDLASGHHAGTSTIAIILTAAVLAVMPLRGPAKHMLAARLGSDATTGEGTQNYLCAAQAAAVLRGLAVAIAAAAAWDGMQAWRGDACC